MEDITSNEVAMRLMRAQKVGIRAAKGIFKLEEMSGETSLGGYVEEVPKPRAHIRPPILANVAGIAGVKVETMNVLREMVEVMHRLT